MLVTYTNNTSIPQTVYDVYSTPNIVAPGASLTYLDRNSLPPNTDILDVRMETDGSGNIIYIGYKMPGTSTLDSSPGWAIKKRVVNGLEEDYVFAGDGLVLRYVWDDRAILSY